MTDAPLRGAAGDTSAAPTRRQAYEARLKRRSNMIAAGSTIAVVLAVVVLVPLAPGWEAVQRSFFNGEVFAATFPGLLNAFMLDVAIFLWCAPAIAILGLLIALCRDVRAPALFPLRMFGALYTDIFRGLPVILVIYLVGFGVPGPRPAATVELALYLGGSLALILVYAAYVARGHPLGDRLHPPEPAQRRRLARPLGGRHDAFSSFCRRRSGTWRRRT